MPTTIALPVRRGTSDPVTLQRATGLVLGAAVGDALGAPFEFKSAGTYRRTFPQPVLGGKGEMIGGGSFGWEPGEFTDDTQMALVLAESLLRCGGVDPDDLFAAFAVWHRTAADVGNTTSEALGQADRHAAAEVIARRGARGSASNGALMRVFPVAVAFLDADEATTIRVALDQSAVTHPPASGWGAAIAAALMRRFLLGADAFAAIPALLAHVPTEFVGSFADVLDPAWAPKPSDLPNGTVWTCLGQAVWAVRHATTFEDALVRAVDLGDDTDTVAVVAGALAGARFAVQAIPSRWRTYVHGKVDTAEGTARYADGDLQDLTRRLLGGTVRPETPPEPAKQPVEVARRLHAADLLGAAGVPNDWAVVSLCRTYGRFAGHPVRREVYLRDQEGTANIGLGHAVRDAVDGIDALLAEGHQVVVHCHGGRSRTALVLKAWAMRHHDLTERQAHAWLLERWPETKDWTSTFNNFLRNDWAAGS